ncbi:hypothetical protein [Ferruginivarius sediminum]|uniref:Phosphatidate cytidylyltransferase n=1 Tax=Ferruginivarius sediminum TaxID=2661937 RepID=A0A369T7H9_9PROT|nr:hypothetical protein [Ferruginivarius sediminum]RDD60832.1 hypothetical protein DRB17_15995 [Ferruginivarius sediminum]
MAGEREALTELITAEVARPVDGDAAALVEVIRARGGGIAAVLLYGSGLWQGASTDRVWDFYVLVDDYQDFDARRLPAWLARVLPPNVYYIEARRGERVLRSKCAVMRLDQFARAAAGHAATPQIWARFAQPCRLVHARDERARETVVAALADAVVTFHRRSLPLVGEGEAGFREVWRAGLAETYAQELRSERAGRPDAVIDAAPDAFAARTRLAVPLTGFPAQVEADDRIRMAMPAPQKHLARAMRPWRRLRGKVVVLLRLMKAAFTFEGGVDYVLWKIERHSGVRVEPNDFQRRHPLIGGWPLLWELYRRGGFR